MENPGIAHFHGPGRNGNNSAPSWKQFRPMCHTSILILEDRLKSGNAEFPGERPMKIAQVAPLFESVPPQLYGGTERVVSYLTEALVAAGNEVTLIASGDSQTSARLIPICPRALRLSNPSRDPLAYNTLQLEKVAAMAGEFDIIHSHVDFFGYPVYRRLGVPFVSTLHGRLDMADLLPLYREFRDVPVVSISDSQRDPLAFANWMGTIYHGLPESLYPFSPGKGGYLAFLGRASPEKGLDRAIKIAMESGIPLKIAAKIDKVDAEFFRKAIRPFLKHPLVEFLGEIGEKEKPEFLGNAKALLFPINWPEPFGLVLIEAMACGTPVIAYPQGSVPEIIEHGANGLLVDDIAGAVKAVLQVDEVPRWRCRQLFEERFSVAAMTGRYAGIYARAIELRQQAHSAEPEQGVFDGGRNGI